MLMVIVICQTILVRTSRWSMWKEILPTALLLSILCLVAAFLRASSVFPVEMVLVRFPFREIMVVVEWFARRVRWVGGLNAFMTSSSSSVSDSEPEGTYSASEDMVARCLGGDNSRICLGFRASANANVLM